MLGSPKSAIAFGAVRAAFGAGLLAAPGRVAAGWLGADSSRPPTQVATRGLGARDIALGAGLVLAVRNGSGLRPWLIGSVACDISDIASTFAAGDALSARARWGTVALAGASVALGAAIAVSADS
jgi:hypothetical protein